MGLDLATSRAPFCEFVGPKMIETCLEVFARSAKSDSRAFCFESRALLFGPGAIQERFKRPPRAILDPCKSSRGSKMRPRSLRGQILIPPGTLGTSKGMIVGCSSLDTQQILHRSCTEIQKLYIATSSPRNPYGNLGGSLFNPNYTPRKALEP